MYCKNIKFYCIFKIKYKIFIFFLYLIIVENSIFNIFLFTALKKLIIFIDCFKLIMRGKKLGLFGNAKYSRPVFKNSSDAVTKGVCYFFFLNFMIFFLN